MLTSLRLDGFRNLERLDLRVPEGSLLVSGKNGSGKTSLLEAIYLLATTRSFRTSRPVRCCRHGTTTFRVEGEFEHEEFRVGLAIGVTDGTRWRTLNGETCSLEEYLGVGRVVCWTSSSSEVVGGGPEARRRFIDRGIVGLRPSALETMRRYRQVLGQKRRLLLRGAVKHGELAAWNRMLSELAAALISSRTEYIAILRESFQEIVRRSGLEVPAIEFEYRPSPSVGGRGSEAIDQQLAEMESRERTARRALVGPHLDQLVVRWGDHDVRHVASAGESKIVGLALMAAQKRVFQKSRLDCLLLLDDLDSELDRGRLRKAWELFQPVDQAIVTTSREEAWNGIDAIARIGLEKGSVNVLLDPLPAL